jgi:hypothetical protein
MEETRRAHSTHRADRGVARQSAGARHARGWSTDIRLKPLQARDLLL